MCIKSKSRSLGSVLPNFSAYLLFCKFCWPFVRFIIFAVPYINISHSAQFWALLPSIHTQNHSRTRHINMLTRQLQNHEINFQLKYLRISFFPSHKSCMQRRGKKNYECDCKSVQILRQNVGDIFCRQSPPTALTTDKKKWSRIKVKVLQKYVKEIHNWTFKIKTKAKKTHDSLLPCGKCWWRQ